MCKHEIHLLVGTADGIVCKGCGKVFKNFAEIGQDVKPKPARRKKKEADDVP